MKKLLFFFILLSPYFTIAQIITTIAGNSIPGYNGDGGLATVANMQAPYQAVSDAVGNVYIADTYNNVIRKISATGIISTFAGTGASGYGGDGGPASAANFNYPISLTFDAAGNLYVADHGNSRIRKISTSGIITTFAGNGSDSHSGDGGPATAASFGSISAICFDAIGNMIMSEYNCYIRKISSTGIITTIAGTGPFGGYSGDGGPATAAQLNIPRGIVADNIGNIYFTDGGVRIRKIDASGIITTIAGSGVFGYSGDGGPATIAQMADPFGLCIDGTGNIYVADYSNARVRKISPSGIITLVAGNGIQGFAGDGGLAVLAQLNRPTGVSIDASGNLFISDMNSNVVRKIAFASSSVNESSIAKLEVSPNPTTNIINIKSCEQIENIEILNLQSQQFFSCQINSKNTQIETKNYPPGVYVLIVNKKYKLMFVKK